MTDSYSLSRRPKIVFFHGLNNNTDCFFPLRKHFEDLGYETDMVVLPCHGENRKEATNSREALRVFDENMKRLQDAPFYAICFSHGGLYLQLWMEKNPANKPLKQVLLAPALFIRKQKIIERALGMIPSFVLIKSLAPKVFRRYEMLTAGEYNILVQGIVTYNKIMKNLRVPSLVMIDPKDELVHAQNLKKNLEEKNKGFEVQFIERPYLKKGPGCHHILFHPDYFSKDDWKNFIQKIDGFLKA